MWATGRMTRGERCFLCDGPLEASDLEDAFERVPEGGLPFAVERAHGECAVEAGLWEEAEEAEEERTRPL